MASPTITATSVATADIIKWTAVDRLLEDHFLTPDDALTHAVTTSDAAGLPPHAVSPLQGRLLHLLASIAGATSILEVGTLGGYSAIHLARALPTHGRLVTLEFSPHHAAVARANLAYAGLSSQVEVIEGPASTSLHDMITSTPSPPSFDLVFIDADKVNNSTYFDYALQLTHPGSLIIVDNVVRGGAIIDDDLAVTDPSVRGVREWLTRVKGDRRVMGTAIQTVGGDNRGYDGFALLRVLPRSQ